ncbi:MAG: calcium-binding protein [Paracoccaceae bacterium]
MIAMLGLLGLAMAGGAFLLTGDDDAGDEVRSDDAPQGEADMMQVSDAVLRAETLGDAAANGAPQAAPVDAAMTATGAGPDGSAWQAETLPGEAPGFGAPGPLEEPIEEFHTTFDTPGAPNPAPDPATPPATEPGAPAPQAPAVEPSATPRMIEGLELAEYASPDGGTAWTDAGAEAEVDPGRPAPVPDDHDPLYREDDTDPGTGDDAAQDGQTADDGPTVATPSIIFGDGSQQWWTGDGDDLIEAGAGDDVIGAGAGDDVIGAGDGDDSVEAGTGHDIVFGDGGDDRLSGWSGDDAIDGGAGDDTLLGGDGDDALTGGDGSDTLMGHAGDDRLTGGAGADQLLGGDGDDHLDARRDDDGAGDIADGGAGDDTLTGGTGDWLIGGAGTDAFEVTAADGAPQIDDFDPATESLTVLHDGPAPVLGQTPFGDGTTITADGAPVAHLRGVETIDLSTVQLRAA